MGIVLYEYEPKIDELIKNKNEQETLEMLSKVKDANRPLFSEETAKKIMSKISDEEIAIVKG